MKISLAKSSLHTQSAAYIADTDDDKDSQMEIPGLAQNFSMRSLLSGPEKKPQTYFNMNATDEDGLDRLLPLFVSIQKILG